MPQTQVSERTVEVEMGWSLLALRQFLNVSEKTIYNWLTAANIKPACRKSVPFPTKDLDNIATFYVATKVLGLTGRVYSNEIVPRSSTPPILGLDEINKKADHLFGLETYYQETYNEDLYQALRMAIDTSQLPPFTQSILNRLKLERDYEYSRAV